MNVAVPYTYRVEDLDKVEEGVFWRAESETGGSVRFRKCILLRETPKGMWIENWPGDRWVSKSTRYVRPTKRAALHDLLFRKRRHVYHSQRRARDAENALLGVEAMMALNCKEEA